MTLVDVAIPILGFGISFTSLLSLKKKLEAQHIVKFIIGIVIMGLSIYASVTNSDLIDTLSNNVKSLLTKREIDSSNNASFQRYLKDTFGIIIQSNKPVIYNTKIYNSQIRKPKTEGLGDQDNYSFRMKNDTLFIAPKEGTWAHGYIAFDTANGTRFQSMLHEGMGTANEVDKININGKIYITHIFKMYDRAVYKEEPIRMSGDLNRYIIFGDQGIPTRRYLYKQGKVSWIPE